MKQNLLVDKLIVSWGRARGTSGYHLTSIPTLSYCKSLDPPEVIQTVKSLTGSAAAAQVVIGSALRSICQILLCTSPS